MVLYNFKSIHVVSSSTEMVDVCLSNTQSKTPTIVRRHYRISRIRQFYMRKVKMLQQLFMDKLELILSDFPQVESIHPFYSDLLNVLYDKDHYKLALSQVNMVRSRIEGVGRDYVRLLKYGENLYQCKRLKIAAMGRMCTLVKKLKSALEYLEHVRQHMSRLPDINPTTRTLILCGYPNVGKSSFLNKVSNANVDVQDYAFTTKSLFVGHMDYKYTRWQVIDTPGILDHPLEDRNTIEMLSITALAHLRAAILFLVDISRESHYSVNTQLSLFRSIMPLFHNKPVVLLLTKCDVNGLNDLDEEDKAAISQLVDSYKGLEVVEISNVTGDGVMRAKQFSCDKLLQQRVDARLDRVEKMSEEERSKSSLLRRLHVSEPAVGAQTRPPVIPEGVRLRKEGEISVRLERESTEEFSKPVHHQHDVGERRQRDDGYEMLKQVARREGGAGLYQVDLQKDFILEKEEWKYDKVPEIMNGKNIADYIDPDISEKLAKLEAEEEERLASTVDIGDVVLDEESGNVLKEIRKKKKIIIAKRHIEQAKSKIPRPKRTNSSASNENQAGSETVRTKRKRAASQKRDIVMEEVEGEESSPKKVKKMSKGERRVHFGATKGDQFHNRQPKHLFSGKRGFSADRR